MRGKSPFAEESAVGAPQVDNFHFAIDNLNAAVAFRYVGVVQDHVAVD